MVYYNLPRIRIKNSNYHPFLEPEENYEALLDYRMADLAAGNYPEHVPEDAYEYLHLFWDVGMQRDDSFIIGISAVPGLGMDFVGRPNDNGILKSKLAEGNQQYLRFLCINIYHFLYDINYPAIVTIRDDSSLKARGGYTFNFAMPVTILNNEPFKESYAYTQFTTTYFDRGFCDEMSDNLVEIRTYGKEDGYSNIEIGDVNLSLHCFKYFCPLGQTQPDAGVYRLNTYLQRCSNPFIVAEKEGYLEAKKQYTGGPRFDIHLTKVKEFDYEVVFHEYDSLTNIMGPAQELTEDMSASMQLVWEDFTQYKLYPSESDIMQSLELIDDGVMYGLDIVLSEDGSYVGGYKGKWQPDVLQIAENNKAIFHVVRYEPSVTDEDKRNMMNYIMAGDYKSVSLPELVSTE
jgi:hypothetical protein